MILKPFLHVSSSLVLTIRYLYRLHFFNSYTTIFLPASSLFSFFIGFMNYSFFPSFHDFFLLKHFCFYFSSLFSKHHICSAHFSFLSDFYFCFHFYFDVLYSFFDDVSHFYFFIRLNFAFQPFNCLFLSFSIFSSSIHLGFCLFFRNE